MVGTSKEKEGGCSGRVESVAVEGEGWRGEEDWKDSIVCCWIVVNNGVGGVGGRVGEDIGDEMGVCIDILLFLFVMDVCGMVIASCLGLSLIQDRSEWWLGILIVGVVVDESELCAIWWLSMLAEGGRMVVCAIWFVVVENC